MNRLHQNKKESNRHILATPKARSRSRQQHDLEVLNLVLNAAKFPKGCRDFTDALIIMAPDENAGDTWFYAQDYDLVKAISSSRNKEERRRILDRIRQQRRRANDWKDSRDEHGLLNAALFEVERDLEIEHIPAATQETSISKESRDLFRTRLRYRLPILKLIAKISETCTPRTSQKILQQTVNGVVEDFLREQRATRTESQTQRKQSIESQFNRGWAFLGKATNRLEILQKHDIAVEMLARTIPDDLVQILTEVISAKSLSEKILPVIAHVTETPHPTIPPTHEKRVVNLGIGQLRDEFISENFDQPETVGPTKRQIKYLSLYRVSIEGLTRAEASARIQEIKNQGIEPFATAAQMALLAKVRAEDNSFTISQASKRIDELVQVGAFTPSEWLTFSELERFDSRPSRSGQSELRFCCPSCGVDKPRDVQHQSLSLNTTAKLYWCHRCHIAGKLRDTAVGEVIAVGSVVGNKASTPESHHENGSQRVNKWGEWYRKARQIVGSPGARYLSGRGVSIEVANLADVKFGQWWTRNHELNRPEMFPAVVFGLRDGEGKLCAAQARAILSPTKRTGGAKREGIFFATPDVLNRAIIAICEAPVDALVLQTAGIPAIALCGTSWPVWLHEKLSGKEIIIATDADEAGDECARKLSLALADYAERVVRVRPSGAKDFAEIAEKFGIEAVVDQIEVVLSGTNLEHESEFLAA